MRKRKRDRGKDRTWEIRRLKGTPAALIGPINVPDEAKAKERAIKQFRIRPEDRDRLIAVQHRWSAELPRHALGL
jgi:hypothetical protein